MVNDSANPNCRMKSMMDRRVPYLCLFALSIIWPDEELFMILWIKNALCCGARYVHLHSVVMK